MALRKANVLSGAVKAFEYMPLQLEDLAPAGSRSDTTIGGDSNIAPVERTDRQPSLEEPVDAADEASGSQVIALDAENEDEEANSNSR